jgi:putative flippase GtrA
MINQLPVRLVKRGAKYATVGGGTYLFDLCLIYIMTTYLGVNTTLAVGLGYLVAVNLNFLLTYYYVYRGTTQTLGQGYLFFITLIFFGALIIAYGTTYLATEFSLPLLLARSIVAIMVGTTNFLINTFFNFKLV